MSVFCFSDKDTVSLFGDIGIGVGFFETIKLKNKAPVYLNRHLTRLNNSLNYFKLGKLPDFFEIENRLLKFLENKNTKGKALKIVAVDNNLHFLLRDVFIPSDSVSICISRNIRFSKNPLVNHKSISYFFNKLLLLEAKEQKAFDSIALNEKGFVTEGGKTNIFVLKDKKLYTPFESDGCLKGIMREIIMEKFSVIEKNISLDFLLNADEVFLTNSVISVVSVSNIIGYEKKFDDKFVAVTPSFLP